ncbi:hypothetical protein [Mycolicibacterium peregrinum]|uniref:hypothetical protein n=1 Tax=Mycolicibacterium peregrinum TaxID=43304 RepID=UPI000AC2B470|nr:hypothetical protein [Mycolicibacterium peregrinum]
MDERERNELAEKLCEAFLDELDMDPSELEQEDLDDLMELVDRGVSVFAEWSQKND